MKKIATLFAMGLFLGFFQTPGSLLACPSCSGSVPWTDGTNGEAESKAYNDSIYFLLAAPTAIVLGVSIVMAKRNKTST